MVDPTTLDSWSNLLGARGGEGQGVSLYGQFGDDFAVFVNALESETKFKTLNRTVLVTKNNRVANLSSGQRIAVPSSSFAGGGVNGTTTNVEYRDVVLELEIQPLINSENEITLEISLVKDDVGTDRQISADLSVPDIRTEELTTSVTVQNGAAVLLGGLITEKEGTGASGFPVLRRIPGLGRLFGNTEVTGERSELVILIRPQIIAASREMQEFRQRYENYSENTPDAMTAFPQSLLPQNGTMPQAPPSGSAKSNMTPVAAPAPPREEKKESKIRRRGGGRNGSR